MHNTINQNDKAAAYNIRPIRLYMCVFSTTDNCSLHADFVATDSFSRQSFVKNFLFGYLNLKIFGVRNFVLAKINCYLDI